MDQASKVLAEFITRSVNVDVYSDVEAAVARFGAGVDAAVGKLSAVSDRLEHYSGAIQKAASQVDESVASTTRAKTVISQDLAARPTLSTSCRGRWPMSLTGSWPA